MICHCDFSILIYCFWAQLYNKYAELISCIIKFIFHYDFAVGSKDVRSETYIKQLIFVYIIPTVYR